MNYKRIFKNTSCLTPFQKVSLCELACTCGSFLNRRSELKKMGTRDININQRYYESYCALLGATKVLGLRFNIDLNARIIDFIKVDNDDIVLSVPISNIVYERFDENTIMEKRFNSGEVAIERSNEYIANKIHSDEIAVERMSKKTEVED